MRAVMCFGGAVMGAVGGYIVALMLSLLIMGWFGVSDFEGERAVTAAFFFGPLGSLAGLVLGLVLARRVGTGAAGSG